MNWLKGIAEWEIGNTLYLSVPFTWLLEDAYKKASNYKGKVQIGGPALMEPNQCEGFDPILFHNPCATFTTRGCVNSCPFCAVPELEGDLVEIENFRPAPIICDNNLLAASKKHIRKVVDSLKQYPYIDFNQGLQASRLTPEIADWLGELKCKVRFSFDSWEQEGEVKKAIDLCREKTTNDIGIYVLIGFDDNHDEAREKLETVRIWGLKPNPQRYQPLDTNKKNSYIAEGWEEWQLRKIMKYYSRLSWYEHIAYEDFGDYEDILLQKEFVF